MMVVHSVACLADAMAVSMADQKAAWMVALWARMLVVLMAGPRAAYLVAHLGVSWADDWAAVSAELLADSKVGQWAVLLAGAMVLMSAGVKVELRADNSAECWASPSVGYSAGHSVKH